MKNLFILILLIQLILSFSCQKSDTLSPNQKDGRIVFGENIDGIKIGDDSTTVIYTLGRPSGILIGDFPGVIFEYSSGDHAGLSITIWTKNEDIVTNISVLNPYSGQTDKLIGIGSNREELHQSYRHPDQTIENDIDIYTYSKIRFIIRYIENQISQISMTSL